MRKSAPAWIVPATLCLMLSSAILSANADPVMIGDVEGMPVRLLLSPPEGTPGSSVILYVFLENRFKNQLDEVVISVTSPRDTEVSPKSLALTKIPVKEARFGTFEISIRPSARSGIYPVIVSVKSDNSTILASTDLTVKEEPTSVSAILSAIAEFFASPVGIGLWFAIVSGAVGSYLKWFFDRRNSRQTFENEVAKDMTKKVLSNIDEYYMHIWTATLGLKDNLEDYTEHPTEDNAKSAFYCFCVRISVWRTIATKGIAFVMKEYEAENRLQELDDIIDEEFSSVLGLTKDDGQAIEKHVKYTHSRQEFANQLARVKELKRIYKKFKDWLAKGESVQKVGQTAAEYCQLFEAQITKIYRPWYRI